ncbi:MAG: hypothetical protein ACFCUG_08255 [Thiotrichales bacterium]
MIQRNLIAHAVGLALALPMSAAADTTFSGYLRNQTSIFTRDGQTIGAADSMLDRSGHDAGDLMMFENAAKLFVNGDIGTFGTWHAELQAIYDSEAVNSDWRGHKSYTQYDWLRELYTDFSAANWQFRVGKQQVVWGTADGIKLLDIINPTDYRHFAQDVMEDSRIPVFMVNAERNFGSAGGLQFIVSEARANVIPGLNVKGDDDHPFMMKGVDAITGDVNGFLNITPALANTAQNFSTAAQGGAFTGGAPNPAGLLPFAGLTVDGFASQPWNVMTPGLINPATPGCTAPNFDCMSGYFLLNDIAQNGLQGMTPGGNRITNQMPVTGTGFFDTAWDPKRRTAAFEHMPNTTFATFNTFAGSTFGQSAQAKYVRDYGDDYSEWQGPNFGLRYQNKTLGGLRYSLNYLYNYDPNPYIDLSWHDTVTGEQLSVQRAQGTPGPFQDTVVPNLATNIGRGEVPTDLSNPANALLNPSILLRNGAGQYYGAIDPTFGMMPGAHSTNPIELRFTEKLQRIHNLGASLDYALDTKALGPVVLRGEFLYQQDTKQPVVDNLLLGVGDLANGLRMESADMFKYVLGADITVLKNMMVSLQFIQFVNLDYVNDRASCRTQTGLEFDCSRYTGDFPTLNPTNGLRRGEEHKEFYSLFFSKPFGSAQQHRWNNITIFEENGGWWNRFDVEYSLTDNLFLMGAWNNYWGEEDTQFGQMKNSSNLQAGVKYLF